MLPLSEAAALVACSRLERVLGRQTQGSHEESDWASEVNFLKITNQKKNYSLLNLLPKLLTPDSFSPSRRHSNMYAHCVCVCW